MRMIQALRFLEKVLIVAKFAKNAKNVLPSGEVK